MPSRFVNRPARISRAEFASGVISYLMGTPSGQWAIWVHRIGGFAIVALVGWKIGIVVRSYSKRGLTFSTFASALLGGLFLMSLAFGLLWSATGVRG
jgi:predicted membrane-bound spermidine synthase